MRMLQLIIFLLLLAPEAYAVDPYCYLGSSSTCGAGGIYTRSIKGAVLNSTGDAGSFVIPSGITKFTISKFRITNCSTTPILAQVGLYSAASAGGTNLAAYATITGATSAAVVLSQTVLGLTSTTGTVYLNVGTANALALTCDAYITIDDLS